MRADGVEAVLSGVQNASLASRNKRRLPPEVWAWMWGQGEQEQLALF